MRMFIKLVNLFVEIFGYEFVRDERAVNEPPEDIEVDEGWDDLYENNPRYRLVKKNQNLP